MSIKHKPLWSSSLSTSINDTTTTIVLNSYSGLTNGETYYFSINRVNSSGNKTLSSREVIKGTYNGTSIVSCVRAQDGTTAKSHGATSIVEIVVTSAFLNDIQSAVDNVAGMVVQWEIEGGVGVADTQGGTFLVPQSGTITQIKAVCMSGTAKIRLMQNGTNTIDDNISVSSTATDTTTGIAITSVMVNDKITLDVTESTTCVGLIVQIFITRV